MAKKKNSLTSGLLPTMTMITAVLNRRATIKDALTSLDRQSFPPLDHWIIDGGSTDGTLAIIKPWSDRHNIVHFGPQGGLYAALNEGIRRSSGEIIGILHADDILARRDVLRNVAQVFKDPAIDAVYGDIEMVNNRGRIYRYWQAGPFASDNLTKGWLPPHTALFLRRGVYARYGLYDPKNVIAGDSEAMLRYFGQPGFRAHYIPQVLVRMRTGGMSNGSLTKVIKRNIGFYQALRLNNIPGLKALIWKNISKMRQLFICSY